MAKRAYIGVDGVARKIKKGYIGVDDVARKIKKAYIGVGGVARPCWSTEPQPTYWGTTSQGLTYARQGLSATTVGSYALFGGGSSSTRGSGSDSGNEDFTDAYNTSLVRISVDRLQDDILNTANAATTVGSYALFGGGRNNNGDGYTNNYTTAYNTSLTRSYPSVLEETAGNLTATTVGNYALFGGGYRKGLFYNNICSGITSYDTSLVRSNYDISSLSSTKECLAATTVGSYALFGGGRDNGSVYNTVDTYNTSLTKGTISSLSVARYDLSATTVGSYALFGGGNNGSNVNTVDAYNSSLTKISISSLSSARSKLAATTLGNFALFGGGDSSSNVDIYDASLTKQSTVNLSSSRYYLAATTVGNYALFGGGQTPSSTISTVDVFVVV